MPDNFVFSQGECLADKGTMMGGLDSQYQAKDLDDLKRYMKDMLINNKSPHVSWAHWHKDDQREASVWCHDICYDKVMKWKSEK